VFIPCLACGPPPIDRPSARRPGWSVEVVADVVDLPVDQQPPHGRDVGIQQGPRKRVGAFTVVVLRRGRRNRLTRGGPRPLPWPHEIPNPGISHWFRRSCPKSGIHHRCEGSNPSSPTRDSDDPCAAQQHRGRRAISPGGTTPRSPPMPASPARRAGDARPPPGTSGCRFVGKAGRVTPPPLEPW
jgi:hypothetical protein